MAIVIQLANERERCTIMRRLTFTILYDMPSDEIRRRNKFKRDEDVLPGQIVELEVDYDFVDSR